MKTLVPSCIFLVLFSVSPLFAETVTVQNDTDHRITLVALSAGDLGPEIDRGRSWFAAVFEEHNEQATSVAPRGVRPISAPSDDLVIVGVKRVAHSTDLPVFYAEKGAGDRFVRIDEAAVDRGPDGTPVTVRSWEAPDDRAPIQVDNRYNDWLSVPDLAAFRRDVRPETFTRIDDGTRTDLDIDDSLLWAKGGTHVERFKALRWEDTLYLMMSSLTPISSRFSILVRVFPERTSESENRVTIEIPADNTAGPVLLWRRGRDEPEVVGEYARSRFLLEARVFADSVVLDERVDDIGSVSFDIWTSVADAGIIEEFHHTTHFVRTIPRAHGP